MVMNEFKLNQIIKMRKEMKSLQECLSSVKTDIVVDTVIGCTPERLDPHVIGISGLDARKSDELIMKMRDLHGRLLEQLCEAEDWIQNIGDSETRDIFRQYYIMGKTQKEIGKTLGYDQSVISRKLSDKGGEGK